MRSTRMPATTLLTAMADLTGTATPGFRRIGAKARARAQWNPAHNPAAVIEPRQALQAMSTKTLMATGPSGSNRLLRRIESEARAFANSDSLSGQLCLGRVYGLLEAGVISGFWRKKDSAAAAELVQHRYRLSKLRDVLLRGDSVTLWRVTDVAEYLGVSHQRVDQLLSQKRLSGPSAISGRTRLWERSLVEAWAERGLVGSRRWRVRH